MITEEKLANCHRILIVCDTKRRGHVHTSADITMSTRDLCNNFLYMLGWRLRRGKQLCPECSARVEKRQAAAGGAR